MIRVFLGGIPDESKSIISKYLDKYVSDYEFEELSQIGSRGKLKNHGKKPDVLLIVIDSSLYNYCAGTVLDVLSQPKVHKYEDDSSLRAFLAERFGEDLAEDISDARSDSVVDTKASSEVVSDMPEILSLQSMLNARDKTINNLRNRIRELSLDNEDYNTYIDEISLLKEKLESIDGKSSKKLDTGLIISGLESNISSLGLEIKALNNTISELREENTALSLERGSSISSSEEMSLKSRVSELESDLSAATELIDSLREQNSKIEELQVSISNLELDLKASMSREEKAINDLGVVKSELSNTELEVSSLKEQLRELGTKLKEKESELKSSEDVVKALNDKVSFVAGSDVELTNLRVEMSKLKSMQASLEESLSDTSNTLEEERGITFQLRESLNLEVSKYAKLEAELGILRDSYSKLESELLIKDTHLEELKTVESELSNYRSLSSKLSVELQTEALKYSSLEKDYISVKSELLNLNSSLKELDSLRSVKKEKEALMSEFDELKDFVDDVKVSPFFLMNNYAMPRVSMSLSLDIDLKLRKSKLVLVSSTTGESLFGLYNTVKSVCEKSKKSFLFVDLVTETFIDSSVGLLSMLPPHEWLSGGDVTQFISETKLSNVTAVTTGVGYINELFFLSVDWSTRLSKLDGLADTIILNIGCIDGVVRQSLYNTFSKVSDLSQIFVKATPTNLRTSINRLSSIQGSLVKKPDIVLFDYDDTVTGSSLFTKLSTRGNSILYSDSIDLGW